MSLRLSDGTSREIADTNRAMRYTADLHLHSRHADAVSSQMTLETFALQARRKGIDVMGTGDCLQPDWLENLENKLAPAENGWFSLKSEVDGPALEKLPEHLRQPFRLVLSTEVNCFPPGSRGLQGIHHLIYFPTIESVRRFQEKVGAHGNLKDGRPSLALTSRQLLDLVIAHDERCHFAPAHVMNPYFSSLGSQMRHRSLDDVFGDSVQHLLAVEMGLTSLPPMNRRIASLDQHALFANSDAHSPENLGRECTLLDTEPGYDAMFAALHAGSREQVLGCVKYSIHRTRYFLNWCAKCKRPYDAEQCPQGHGRLITGSRDYLEDIATRPEPAALPKTPRFRQYVPLREFLGEFLKAGETTRKVRDLQEQLLRHVGHERDILTKAPREQLAQASSPDLADALLAQRTADYGERITIEPLKVEQGELL